MKPLAFSRFEAAGKRLLGLLRMASSPATTTNPDFEKSISAGLGLPKAGKPNDPGRAARPRAKEKDPGALPASFARGQYPKSRAYARLINARTRA